MHYRYSVDIYRDTGRHAGAVPIEPDWGPAQEWARFEGLRRGQLPPVTAPPPMRVEPVWHAEVGAPLCAAFAVVTTGRDGELRTEIPRDYVRVLAERQATALVARGELNAGERFRYHVLAVPDEREAMRAPSGGFEAVPVGDPLPLRETDLAALVARAEPARDPSGEAVAAHADDPRVFLPRAVIEQTRALAAEAGEVETGGVLLGALHRAPRETEIFVEITGQIPARHARGEATRFEFTPETWADAEAALRLRGRGEQLLGWWHSHPMFCRACPDERRRDCVFARPFFSPEDVHLHRTCFAHGWQLALLVSELPEHGHCPSLFGWRRGTVAARGFDVLD